MPFATYEELAGSLEFTILDPQLAGEQVVAALDLAKRSAIACAIVRPCDADLAVRTLQASTVRPGSVVGFPYGYQTTAVKVYEAGDLLRRGIKEISVSVAVASLRSREFRHVETELEQIAALCHKQGAIVTAVLDHEHLTDELRIIACRCFERAEIDFVTADAAAHAALLRKYVPEEIKIKASVATLDEITSFQEAGCTRLAVSDLSSILAQWKSSSPAHSA